MKTGLFFKIAFFIFCLPFYGVGQITYVVNTTDDLDDGVCDGGHCSLREAVNASNNDDDASEIHFNIVGAGPHTINSSFSLQPTYSSPISIDGTTQPGNNPISGKIIIENSSEIFTINQNDVTIKGLSFIGADEPVIDIFFGTNIIIEDNYFQSSSSGSGIEGGADNLSIKNNYFYNNSSVYLFPVTNCVVKNNLFGISPQGIITGGNGGLSIPSDFMSFGEYPDTITNNKFYGLNSALLVDIGYVSNNLFYCNDNAFQTSLNPMVNGYTINNQPPSILSYSNGYLSGSVGQPGTVDDMFTIEFYKVLDDSCTTTPCQGSTYIGETITFDGFWSFELPDSINFGDKIIAIGRLYLISGMGGATDFPTGLSNCIELNFECNSTIENNNTVIVSNTNDSGSGSLREAIECANYDIDVDSIIFELSGTGPFIFNLDSPLPCLVDGGIIINGMSQNGYNSIDYLQIEGALCIYGSSCEVYGLSLESIEIQGWNNQIGKPNMGNQIYGGASNGYDNNSLLIYGNGNIIQSNYIGVGVDGVSSTSGQAGISIGTYTPDGFTTYGGIGNIIGGSRLLNEGNYLSSSIRVFGSSSYYNGPRTMIKGNNIGIGVDDSTALDFQEFGIEIKSAVLPMPTGNQEFNIDIGGTADEANIISQCGTAISIDDPDQIVIGNNSIFCNNNGVTMPNGFATNPAPNILAVNENGVLGTSDPNNLIELYKNDDSSCPGVACQGKIYLGNTTADNSGNWIMSINPVIEVGDYITAIATSYNNIGELNNSSSYSTCFIVLPDFCEFAETLPMNNQACSEVGIIEDLKQLTYSDSNPPTSGCANTSNVGNDAWYKVTVPQTRNFLLRANTVNTVTPIIEFYTSCGAAQAQTHCQVLDTLPYLMVFEGYTPGATLFLRVWDKGNEVVNSGSTSLLHLTAHKLDSLKSNWVICDYETLNSNNPTQISRREATTFIVEYDSLATMDSVLQTTAELDTIQGIELQRECLCNGTPLQLWGVDSPIELETRRRITRKKANVDTTNYNYVFESIEFQVNSYAKGQQFAAAIDMDDKGNFVMAWKDEQRENNFGRVYKSSGNPIAPEFKIGNAEKIQENTQVGIGLDGNFMVVWNEYDRTQPNAKNNILGILFDKEGHELSDRVEISRNSKNSHTNPIILGNVTNNSTNPKIAMDSLGNFIVVWDDEGYIYAQKFDNLFNPLDSTIAVGFDTTFQILKLVGESYDTTYANHPKRNSSIKPAPSVSLHNNGEFIVTWHDISGTGKEIYAQMFNADNTPKAAPFRVNTYTNQNQCNPDIVYRKSDGSFTIVWESENQDGDGSGIFGQHYDDAGIKNGIEFQINSYTDDNQKLPSISSFKNGSFIVAWSSNNQDGYEEGIYAKLFDEASVPIMPNFEVANRNSGENEFRMNTYHEPQQDYPQTATNGDNLFMGAWEDGHNDTDKEGVFAQRYEVTQVNGNLEFYPIGTATPSTLLGDTLFYPSQTYIPANTQKKVKVAIIDTGVEDDHDLLIQAIWQNPNSMDGDGCIDGDLIGYDYVREDNIPDDLDGHGTQVNGVITRNFDSEVKLELINLKFHEKNYGSVFDAICAIYYAVDNGAKVINLSWGFEASEEPLVLKKALQYAAAKDVLIVTTAGNTSKDNDEINKYPANLDIENMIVVTAYEKEGGMIELADYASYGKTTVDIAAYGFVETSHTGNIKDLSAGTSMAAPAVARTAAIIKGLYPILKASEIKDCILSTATQYDELSNYVFTSGILNHEEAKNCAAEKAEMIIDEACQTTNLMLTESITPACGGSMGEIEVNVSGTDINPDFLWSTGDTVGTITNLISGNYEVTVTDTARCEISLSIEVTDDCTMADCQSDLVINDSSIESQTYSSSNYILSTGEITADSSVVFEAADSIVLRPGFQARFGSTFIAKIDDCSSNLNLENMSKSRENERSSLLEELKVEVYPNPVSDLLTVKVFKNDIGFKLDLYDLLGRQLFSKKVEQNSYNLAVSNLKGGIYFVKIDSKITRKIIVVN